MLASTQAMSADGTVIIGVGYNPRGIREGWIAVIPEPRAVLLFSAGTGGFQTVPDEAVGRIS
jgi:hypothetical protein